MAALFLSTRSRAPALLLAAAALLGGCVTLTSEPRVLLERDDGSISVQTLACGPAVSNALRPGTRPTRDGLDPDALRVVSWNIHKQADRGWQRDLQWMSRGHDLVLLQESVLDPQLRELIAGAGLRWVMASSFLHGGSDIGVLTAARMAPIANCTQRVVEPLLRIPKSAVISWFALRDRSETLAVVNVHAINFSLSLGAYRAQFAAIGDALADHQGPMIVAGDLNTWTDERAKAVADLARRLKLTEVTFAVDRRSAFFGHELDHIYMRGLVLVDSSTTAVSSSDHNPVAATLRAAR
ncbi:MAG TPA: endonuclease/exonuclease/phosphatase family protein [Casimicrobiaceae bacterium]|nr:endonuclease/exonuclease/phosphatase family protein [Casimicrobiaceae bacterium]